MSQTFWEPEVSEEHHTISSNSDAGALALSAADFTALEERVVRAVELVKKERQARAAAEERATKAEAELAEKDTALAEHSTASQQLKQEVQALRSERDQVRQRVERLLSQLDALEL